MQIVSNFFVIVKHGNASLFSLFVFLYFSICCYLASEGGFRTLRSLCLLRSVLVLPLDVTTPRDSYAWNYRELVTLHTLCVNVWSGQGLEPRTLESVVIASNN